VLQKYIIAGCECWLTPETREELDELLTVWEPDESLWEEVQEAKKVWKQTGNPADWDYYSDLHKDCYGFRPHFE
jgi:hypothetical protein